MSENDNDRMSSFNYYHDKLYELVGSVGRLEAGMKNIDAKLDRLIRENNTILESHNNRISKLEAKTNEFEGAIKMLKLEVTIVTVIIGVLAIISHVEHIYP